MANIFQELRFFIKFYKIDVVNCCGMKYFKTNINIANHQVQWQNPFNDVWFVICWYYAVSCTFWGAHKFLHIQNSALGSFSDTISHENYHYQEYLLSPSNIILVAFQWTSTYKLRNVVVQNEVEFRINLALIVREQWSVTQYLFVKMFNLCTVHRINFGIQSTKHNIYSWKKNCMLQLLKWNCKLAISNT